MNEDAERASAHADSEFRAALERLLAGQSSDPGKRQVIFLDCLDTRVGPLVIGATRDALCLLEFSDLRRLASQIETLGKSFDAWFTRGPNALLTMLRLQLREYFAETRRSFDLPLEVRGTPFQKKVWAALMEIGYGETWSYRELASRVGDARAARAVGTANGMNRIAIVIPCHRVINTGGALGGYGGGLLRKRFLLDLECGQQQIPTL